MAGLPVEGVTEAAAQALYVRRASNREEGWNRTTHAVVLCVLCALCVLCVLCVLFSAWFCMLIQVMTLLLPLLVHSSSTPCPLLVHSLSTRHDLFTACRRQLSDLGDAVESVLGVYESLGGYNALVGGHVTRKGAKKGGGGGKAVVSWCCVG